MWNLVRDTVTPPPRIRDIYMKLGAYVPTSAGASARENLYASDVETGRKSRRGRVVINTREGALSAEIRWLRFLTCSNEPSLRITKETEKEKGPMNTSQRV